MEVTEAVNAAFTGSPVLMGMVKDVYHIHAPAGSEGRYPYIVYSTIADVPRVTADNTEIERRVSVRIHIVTKDGGAIPDIYAEVQRLMLALGFMRAMTNDIYDDGDFVRVADYRTGVEA